MMLNHLCYSLDGTFWRNLYLESSSKFVIIGLFHFYRLSESELLQAEDALYFINHCVQVHHLWQDP